MGFLGGNSIEVVREIELGKLDPLQRPVGPAKRNRLALLQRSVDRPTYGSASMLVTQAWSGWPST
jgi:hypothetical protein